MIQNGRKAHAKAAKNAKNEPLFLQSQQDLTCLHQVLNLKDFTEAQPQTVIQNGTKAHAKTARDAKKE